MTGRRGLHPARAQLGLPLLVVAVARGLRRPAGLLVALRPAGAALCARAARRTGRALAAAAGLRGKEPPPRGRAHMLSYAALFRPACHFGLLVGLMLG